MYFLACLFGIATASSQIVNIPDPAFKARLLAANGWNNVAINASGYSAAIDTNLDGEIQMSEAQAVRKLNVYNSSYIQDMTGIAAFTNITSLDCSVNGISVLDVSMLPLLETLNCNDNNIVTLNVAGLTALESLQLNQNAVTQLDLSTLTSLKTVDCYGNQLSVLNIANLSQLETVNAGGNQLSSLNTSGLPSLVDLQISLNQFTSFDATNLPALKVLAISSNPNLSTVNISGMQNLQSLHCGNGQIASLDLSNVPSLEQLYCEWNLLQTLDLSALPLLSVVYCEANDLTSVNFGSNSSLTYVNLNYNQLSSVDVSQTPGLLTLLLHDNELTSIDLTGLHELYTLGLNDNQLTELDLTDLPNVFNVECARNQLVSINAKNGNDENWISMAGNQTLQFVCVDASQEYDVRQMLLNISYFPEYYSYYTIVSVSDYCSFVPGGEFYTLQGNATYDMNANGCDIGSIAFPNFNLHVSDGILSGNFLPDASGSYTIPLQAGSHTISPALENPEYFTVSPQSVTLTFPSEVDPVVQNFCITPNGQHSDLEVIIIPVGPARPGFDAYYQIIYKNKGTTTLSGSITFTYQEQFSDFVTADPIVNSQSPGMLSWNYTDLLPFETRSIVVTLNINSPMEIPAVNMGDQLDFDAEIFPIAGDGTPWDNDFGIKQTVVNSLDPNDKICLEGNNVGPEMIGEYVHYMIRFENTGTFPAENIVVRDMIDLEKFDIATLVPLHASHSFETRISAMNKVEFIFENIMLPFDDLSNDGYIAFKIKTLPTLQTGNSFSNAASIYFDYNFPIDTNTATTAIQLLEVSDFDFDQQFTIYPNPARDVLNIKVADGVTPHSAAIYNMLGQKAIDVVGWQSIIDVSSLQAGNYMIKVISDQGDFAKMFMVR